MQTKTARYTEPFGQIGSTQFRPSSMHVVLQTAEAVKLHGRPLKNGFAIEPFMELPLFYYTYLGSNRWVTLAADDAQHPGRHEIDHHFGGALLWPPPPPTGRMPMSHVTAAITVTIPRKEEEEK